MKLVWQIAFERRSVPGWTGTLQDWWIVVNPHGGVQSFSRTEAEARADLARYRAEWFCQCDDKACQSAPVAP
jgi:hypothetical protein